MADIELRFGDIPGLTEEEKKGFEIAAKIIAEQVEKNIVKSLASKDDVEALIQQAMKDRLQASLPGGDEKALLHDWCSKFFGALVNGSPYSELSSVNKHFSERGLKITTGSTGMTNVLPVSVVDEVEAYARRDTWELDVLRVVPVDTMTGIFPVGTSTRCTTYIVNQGAQPTQSTPTMGGHGWSLLRFAAELPISRQLLQYSVPAFLRYMIEELAYSKAVAVSAQFAVGTDSSQWQGLETASISEVTDESALQIDKVVNTHLTLPAMFRRRAIWVCNSGTLKILSTLRDGNNQLVFPVQSQLDNLRGLKLYVNDSLSDGRLYIGDPTRYHIYTGNTMEVSRIDTGYTPTSTDSVYLIFNWDSDGGVSDVNAWRYCILTA